jgi:ribosomal protein L7/L12
MDEHDFISLKARVAELEERLEFLYKRLGVQYTNQPPMADPQILDAIRRGNKIEAIKIYRELTNADLAEAKRAVEKIESNIL